MAYLFGDDGTYAGVFPPTDDRVFVLTGLNRSIPAATVTAAISNQTPARIDGFAVTTLLSERVVRDLAATVFSESSHVVAESEGIMRVIRNRAELMGLGFGAPTFWRPHSQGGIGGETIDGRRAPGYALANTSSIDLWTSQTMRNDLSATIRAICGQVDITNGAYFWVATAALNNGSNLANGLGANPPVYVVIATLGATTFLQYNGAHPVFGGRTWP